MSATNFEEINHEVLKQKLLNALDESYLRDFLPETFAKFRTAVSWVDAKDLVNTINLDLVDIEMIASSLKEPAKIVDLLEFLESVIHRLRDTALKVAASKNAQM